MMPNFMNRIIEIVLTDVLLQACQNSIFSGEKKVKSFHLKDYNLASYFHLFSVQQIAFVFAHKLLESDNFLLGGF